MPGLVAFRRRWSVGSDDLVVPGAFLVILHTAWLCTLGVLLGTAQLDHEVECVHQLWQHIICCMSILAFSTLLELSISVVSLRGSILDTEKRASVKYLIYMRLVAMILEVGWLSLGTVWLFVHYTKCPADGAKEVLMGVVVCNWFVVLCVCITLWCTFDAAGRSWVKMKKYQRSMRESESRFQYKRSGIAARNWRQRKVIRAYQDSWDHRCRLLFCCMRNNDRNRNSFADIARLLSDFFRDLDVVPSDVVVGLVLLRKFQKIERETIVKENRNDIYEYLSGVPVTAQTQFLALSDPEDLNHFNATIHYMHFALAAYGWPMFLMTNSRTGICQLAARLRCGCLFCMPSSDSAVIIEDNCCQCNYAALRKLVDVGQVEVVYATYHVDVGQTPFFVAVDYSRRTVIVSIRGTLSMKDVITDLNAEGETLPVTPPREDWVGHKGMVQAAEYIRLKLEEENILQKAFLFNVERGTDEFGLVLVGHSLGAGTASILAILLRQTYPSLQCFAYSPPGGSLSMPAVEYTKSFITSVVLGKDVVPRIGLHQLESLRADLINTIKRSKDPKWKTIMCSVVCCGCATTPTSAIELRADGSNITQYQKEKEATRVGTTHPSDSSIALTVHQPLYPPGRIIHIVRHHPGKKENVMKKKEPVYQAVWANNTDFDEVLISPVMIQDHMPDNVLHALNKVVTAVGPTKPPRTLPNKKPVATCSEHLEYEICHLLGTANKAPGSPKEVTPPHKLCLETSFTSLQSPSSDTGEGKTLQSPSSIVENKPTRHIPHSSSEYTVHPAVTWEFTSIAEEELVSCANTHSVVRSKDSALLLNRWGGIAPLASPESLSEVSSIFSAASSIAGSLDQHSISSEKSSSHYHHSTCHCSNYDSYPVAFDTLENNEYENKKINHVVLPVREAKPCDANSSNGELSFESACGTDCVCSPQNSVSSEIYFSIRGTPTSSSSSVLIKADSCVNNVFSKQMRPSIISEKPLCYRMCSKVHAADYEFQHGHVSRPALRKTTFSSLPVSLQENKFLRKEETQKRNVDAMISKISLPDNISSDGRKESACFTPEERRKRVNFCECQSQSKCDVECKNDLNQKKRDFSHASKLESQCTRLGADKGIYSKIRSTNRTKDVLSEYFCSSEKSKKTVAFMDDSMRNTEENDIPNPNACNNNIQHYNILQLEAEKSFQNLCNSKLGKANTGKKFPVNNHVHLMESLPLLSNIGEVPERDITNKKKYTFAITSVGRGESSV